MLLFILKYVGNIITQAMLLIKHIAKLIIIPYN